MFYKTLYFRKIQSKKKINEKKPNKTGIFLVPKMNS